MEGVLILFGILFVVFFLKNIFKINKVINDARDFVGSAVTRIEAYAKEHGLTRAEAEKKLGEEYEARKAELIRSGVPPSDAEDRAFAEVFKF